MCLWNVRVSCTSTYIPCALQWIIHMSLQCSFWYVVDHRGIFDGRPIGHHGHGFLRVLSRPQFIMLDIPVLVIIPVFSMMLFTVRFTSIVVLTIKSNPFIITRNVGGFAIKVIFRSIHFKSQKVNSTSKYGQIRPFYGKYGQIRVIKPIYSQI